MDQEIKAIPEGYHSVTPQLIVAGAKDAIKFYGEAFGAVEHGRFEVPGTGKLAYASLQIGDSMLMLCDAFPEWGSTGPSAETPSPVVIHIYTEDCDALVAQAEAAGAEVTMPPGDMFWGDRYAMLRDPFHHVWSIATRKKSPSPEDFEAGAKAAFEGGPNS